MVESLVRAIEIGRSERVTVIGPPYCGFDGNVCSFDQAKCMTAVKIVCERQKSIFEGNIPQDIKLGELTATKGSITYACPKCGALQMGHWIQTTVHSKENKTEVSVFECHGCKTFFVITKKVVNVREVKPTELDFTRMSIWTEIKAEDLKY